MLHLLHYHCSCVSRTSLGMCLKSQHFDAIHEFHGALGALTESIKVILTFVIFINVGTISGIAVLV